MQKLLKIILKLLAQKVIKRYQPVVVGVTGSVGKTTAKEAIYSVLSRKFLVWRNKENFNNELGVPMTVLDIDPKQKKLGMVGQLMRAFWLAYGLSGQEYPKVLVLELAADRPGDIGYLIEVVQPQIGVVTAVGEVPVHVVFYASPEAVAQEKAKLIEFLPQQGGLAVLNYDDQTVLDMKEKSKAKVVTFGFSNSADVWVSDISYFASDDSKSVGGLSFKINQGSTFLPVRINDLIGSHQLYGILAATAVGSHFEINLIDISHSLENIDLPHGRMNLLRGIKNSIIIDDTYNASPLSMHAALDALRDFATARDALEGAKTGRRIAVLGDMRELGKYEVQAHQAVGNFAAERCDILITVGLAAKFIASAAFNQMAKENIMSFDDSKEAKSKIKEIIPENDVILVTGSQGMRMEKIVEEIMSEPERASELLCRQYGKWLES